MDVTKSIQRYYSYLYSIFRCLSDDLTLRIYNYCLRLAITYVWSRHNYIKMRSQMNYSRDFWRYDICRQCIWIASMHTIQILIHHVTSNILRVSIRWILYGMHMSTFVSSKLLFLTIFCTLCDIWVIWSAFNSTKSPQAYY